MGFLELQLYGFRNLAAAQVATDAALVFLIGENGQGKTNVLEALYLLCFGSSFRTRQEDELITNGMDSASVQGEYCLESELSRRISVRLRRKRRKEIGIDGKPVRDRQEMLRNVPCILFSPEDLQFISGAPERKRWFFNQTLSLLDPLFLDDLRRYQKVVRSRNVLLHERKSHLLDIYDHQLVRYGLNLIHKRAALIAEFNTTLGELFQRISGLSERLSIEYRPSWSLKATEDELLGQLARRREQDLRLGTTTSGPHRDGFDYRIGGRDFVPLASTGQVRLGSLILRVAQAAFFHSRTGRKPVLLLDDVLLELDTRRREAFLKELPPYEQAFFTFLPDEPYERYRHGPALLYRVRAGELEAMSA